MFKFLRFVTTVMMIVYDIVHLRFLASLHFLSLFSYSFVTDALIVIIVANVVA